jgi:hypothetical protein
MFGRKNTQGDGRFSRLAPQKVLHTCKRNLSIIRNQA